MSISENIPLILSISAIVISAIHFLLDYLSKKRTQAPTINISVNELPPYRDRNAKTHITIQNTGTSIAYYPEFYIIYSYTEGETNIPLDEDSLNVNEIKEIYERLVEPPSGTHEIKFIMEFAAKRSWGTRYTFSKTVEIYIQ